MPGRQTIGIGTVANDDTGDTARAAFDKCNDNFIELYTTRRYDVKNYGAIGDGAADDLAAINSCISAAESVGGTIVFPSGTYKITAGITIKTHCISDYDAQLSYDPASPGTAVTLGAADGNKHSDKYFHLPKVVYVDKPSNAWDTAKGIVGYSLDGCVIKCWLINGFSVGLECHGYQNGFQYCDIYVKQFLDNKISVYCKMTDPGGWTNENNFWGGQYSVASGHGDNTANSHAVKLEGLTNNCNGNKWFGGSMSSRVFDYIVNAINAAANYWYGIRWEDGDNPGYGGTDVSFTAGTNTITAAGADFTALGFGVGDIIHITGSTSNNGWFTVATVGTTTMTTTEALSTEALGDDVDIQNLEFIRFDGVNTKRNIIFAGAHSQDLRIRLANGSHSNSIISGDEFTYSGSSASEGALMRVHNGNSVAEGYISFCEPAADPYTIAWEQHYSTKLEGRIARWKRQDDTADRVVCDGSDGVITVGNGTDKSVRLAHGEPHFNVKAYGAVGDNSTDDTTAIQAAIDAAAAVSGDATVFVPTGLYKCTATINLKQRVHIVGTGPFNSQLRFSGTNLIGIKNATGTRLTEISIRDLGILTQSNERHVLGLDLEDVSDSYFDRIAILGASTGTAGRDGWRTALKIHSNDNTKGSFRNRFNDCVIIAEAPSHDAADITFTTGTNTITSATADFTADGFTVGQTLLVAGSSGGTNDGTYTIATVGTTTMTTSEALSTLGAVAGTELTQIDAAKAVHSLSDGPANMGGNSCRFMACTIVARGGDGVKIDDGNNMVFDACIFEGRTRRGVYISGPDGDNVVMHCRFENTTPNNINTAIKIDAGDPRNIITGNTLGGLLATYVDNAEVSSRIEMATFGGYHNAADVASFNVDARGTGQYIIVPQISQNSVITLPNGTAASGKAWRNQRFSIIRNAATPGTFTLTVDNHDGTDIKVIPNDTKARVDVYFDGTDWQLEGYQTL